MTQPSVYFPRPTALLALAMFFMTSVLKAQLDVDTLDVPTATVSAVQAATKILCGHQP